VGWEGVLKLLKIPPTPNFYPTQTLSTELQEFKRSSEQWEQRCHSLQSQLEATNDECLKRREQFIQSVKLAEDVAEKFEAEQRRNAQLQTEIQRTRSADISSRVFNCAFLTEFSATPKLDRLPAAPRRSTRRGRGSTGTAEGAGSTDGGRIAELEAQLAAERRARQEAEKVHQRERRQWERDGGKGHNEDDCLADIRDTCRNW
jgi:hypothetical protein